MAFRIYNLLWEWMPGLFCLQQQPLITGSVCDLQDFQLPLCYAHRCCASLELQRKKCQVIAPWWCFKIYSSRNYQQENSYLGVLHHLLLFGYIFPNSGKKRNRDIFVTTLFGREPLCLSKMDDQHWFGSPCSPQTWLTRIWSTAACLDQSLSNLNRNLPEFKYMRLKLFQGTRELYRGVNLALAWASAHTPHRTGAQQRNWLLGYC